MKNNTRGKIFIGGHRKGGTTLFLSLLDNHPQLSVYPVDTFVLYAYYPIYTQSNYSNDVKLDRLNTVMKYLENLFVKNKWEDRIDIPAMNKLFFNKIQEIDLSDISAILSALIDSYNWVAKQNNTDRKWDVIKETSIEIYAKYLLETFPKSKFIHILRDPRDNYAALKSGISKRYNQFSDDSNTILSSMIHRYGLGIKLAKINQKHFGTDRYIVIRHEDVAKEAHKSLQKICSFLEIDFTDSLLTPSVMGKPTKGNNFEGIDMSSISSINISRWDERITEREAKIIEFYFKDIMEEYGYICTYDIDEQIDAVSDFYKWSNYKYFYFDHFNKR